MLRIPAYFREIARDTALVGRDSQIWVISLESLDFYEYHELLLDSVAAEFDPPISKASVHRSLQRLVEHGYLDRSDEHGAHGKALYRIPLMRIYPRADGETELHK